jgi:hypothetical protein
MKKITVILIVLITNFAFSQEIKVKGKWDREFSVSDIKDVGSDYDAYYLSDEDQSKLSVSSENSEKQEDLYADFKIYVSKDDDEWNPNIIIQVRRTSNGTNNNLNIFSGTEFQTVTDSPIYFFNTIGEQIDVPIQYKVIGLSVLLPAESYSTEIVFTVLDL